MTIEELKNKLISEAQVCWNKLNITKRACGSEFSYYDGYVDCGFIDAEQIRALQKQNGELTDKVKELEVQIEKMRNCANCKNYNGNEGFCVLGSGYGYNCNLEKWEIKEND